MPASADADANETPAGKASVTTTPVAALGDAPVQFAEDWAGMRTTFAGSVSLTTTLDATSGPLLVTVKV